MKIDLTTLKEIDSVAKKILENSPHRIFLVYGEMGAGKTTLIKAIGKQLNTTDEVISPTFAIANVYETLNGNHWFHLDLYRIKDIEELMEIGIEEYLNPEHYCFIEWPQLIEPFIEYPFSKIQIHITGNEKREIILEK